ncbi:GlsB/YeaQ/YmgE family stress response membrane protein [uncultured Lamprocystis sp.]|uniref:GlsB/YeaQ/YmgE family stress response membrane protein n=1 Tax=uncultured Lamprocystis sp. TaxID=543132 RepID=UPI0025D62A4A|nr:GlsB/YeaQ/YmgE family stress response membrane protein [uncultured Lamprocystis sp.]
MIWIVIGAFAGVAARKLIGGEPPFGMIGDVILGMVGGALGGTLVSLAGDLASFVWLVGSVVTALLGAALLIWVASFIQRKPG